jgi:hypothetical protein
MEKIVRWFQQHANESSVHFVSDSLALPTLRALSTLAGGEVDSGEEY